MLLLLLLSVLYRKIRYFRPKIFTFRLLFQFPPHIPGEISFYIIWQFNEIFLIFPSFFFFYSAFPPSPLLPTSVVVAATEYRIVKFLTSPLHLPPQEDFFFPFFDSIDLIKITHTFWSRKEKKKRSYEHLLLAFTWRQKTFTLSATFPLIRTYHNFKIYFFPLITFLISKKIFFFGGTGRGGGFNTWKTFRYDFFRSLNRYRALR